MQLTWEEIERLKYDEGLTWKQVAEQDGRSWQAVRAFYRRHADSGGPRDRGLANQFKATDTTEGNQRELLIEGIPIRNIDDLLDFYGVDRDEWIVRSQVVNFWGSTENPNGQVKASLMPTEPEAVRPVVNPVKVTVTPSGTPRPDDGVERALHLFDPHVGFRKSLRTAELEPFHDRRAIDAVTQVAQSERFDYVIWHGDLLDLADHSDKFIRHPNLQYTTQPAALECAWNIGRMVAAQPEAEHVAIEGNHDVRFLNRVLDYNKESYGLRPVDEMEGPALLSIERLLGLDGMGVEWIGDYPAGEYRLNDWTTCSHGDTVSSVPGGTTSRVVKKATLTHIFGHIHRIEKATRRVRTVDGYRNIEAVSGGCLCRLDGIVPGSDPSYNWQNGFAVTEWDGDGLQSVRTYPIEDGVAIYNGQRFEGEERVDELSDATGWIF